MGTTKIKLLIAVPALECGGLERNVAFICNNIDTAIFDVTLAVLDNTNPFFIITNKEVKVIDLKIKNVRMSLPRLLKLSRSIQPDIILSTANHLNLLFGIFRWLFPKRTRMIARESSIVSINSKNAKLPGLYDRLLKIFYKKLDLIVCQSVYMQDDLVKHYHVPINKTTVIYNAVNTPYENNVIETNGSIAKLITVARLSPEKGLDRLIKAVALLKIPYQFTIIGEGKTRQQLEKLIKSLSLEQKVFLSGSSSKPFAEVSGADLFLMGSYYEGFPNALLEALAAGIPVVAFNAPGGIGEVLEDHKNGLLITGDNIQDFAEAIQSALAFDFSKTDIKKATLKRFNAQVIMKDWQKLFLLPGTA